MSEPEFPKVAPLRITVVPVLAAPSFSIIVLPVKLLTPVRVSVPRPLIIRPLAEPPLGENELNAPPMGALMVALTPLDTVISGLELAALRFNESPAEAAMV